MYRSIGDVKMYNEITKSEETTNTNAVVVHHGSLYDYSCGCVCGVLVKENVMKRLARLQQEHLHKVKQLLTDEADKGNVFSSMWTLHYPNDVQTNVKFIDTSVDVLERIATATRHDQPKHEPLVFIAGSMGEAERMADSHTMDQLETLK